MVVSVAAGLFLARSLTRLLFVDALFRDQLGSSLIQAFFCFTVAEVVGGAILFYRGIRLVERREEDRRRHEDEQQDEDEQRDEDELQDAREAARALLYLGLAVVYVGSVAAGVCLAGLQNPSLPTVTLTVKHSKAIVKEAGLLSNANAYWYVVDYCNKEKANRLLAIPNTSVEEADAIVENPRYPYELEDRDHDGGVCEGTIFNAAPVNSVPVAQETNEDTMLTFNNANNNLISISDARAGNNEIKTRLEVTHGTLTLGATSGLTLTTGDGSEDTDMLFTGTVASINNALSGLTFDPTANYSGRSILTITTNDQGHTGAGGAKSDTDPVTITVKSEPDAPVADSKSITTDEDVPKPVTLSATDNDTPSLTYKITSVPTHGELYKGDSTDAADEIKSTDLRFILPNSGNQVTYKPNPDYSNTDATADTFKFRANDGSIDSKEATVSVSVNSADNDPPTADAGGPYSVNEGSSVVVGASGNDPEGGKLTYKWDLDSDGFFETPGKNATFSASNLEGPVTYEISVRLVDSDGASSVAKSSVRVEPLPPPGPLCRS